MDVEVEVPGIGRVTGDIAWGGNWFFIAHLPDPPLELRNLGRLLDVTRRIAAALRAGGITGAEGAEIDHALGVSEAALLLGVRFEQDVRYLVAVEGGQVMV